MFVIFLRMIHGVQVSSQEMSGSIRIFIPIDFAYIENPPKDGTVISHCIAVGFYQVSSLYMVI